jgi:hypothetical protein
MRVLALILVMVATTVTTTAALPTTDALPMKAPQQLEARVNILSLHIYRRRL